MSAVRLSDLGKEPDTTATLAEPREEYNAPQGAIDDLRTCLDEVRATQNALTTTLTTSGNAATNAATNTAAPLRGHLRILDPEKYKGDREKLHPFITHLRLKAALYPDYCNGDISYNEGLLQEVQTMTMTMTDVECLRLI